MTGRPKKSFRMSEEVERIMLSCENPSKFIREAIVEKWNNFTEESVGHEVGHPKSPTVSLTLCLSHMLFLMNFFQSHKDLLEPVITLENEEKFQNAIDFMIQLQEVSCGV